MRNEAFKPAVEQCKRLPSYRREDLSAPSEERESALAIPWPNSAKQRRYQLLNIYHSLFGFLLGSVIAGAGLYYYVIDEYKVSNELLTEDIYVRASLWQTHVPSPLLTQPRLYKPPSNG